MFHTVRREKNGLAWTAVVLLAAGGLAAIAATADAQTGERSSLTLNAADLYNRAVTDGVRLAEDGRAVVLESGVLIEDDGPAAGYSYQPNEELLTENVWIKKELVVDRPAVRQATLLVGRQPGRMPQPLMATINGREARLEDAGRAGNYWEAYRIDPALLRQGKNEVVLRGAGKIWIARDDEYAVGSRERMRHPNRSAKSTDGGKTWNYDDLGTRGGVDGEYYVRLFLVQYRPSGKLVLGVMDVANLAGRPVAPPLESLPSVKVALHSEGNVRLQVRSGSTFVPRPETWSPWQTVLPGALPDRRGRYVQLAIELTSDDRLSTPRVEKLVLTADPVAAPGWTAGIKITESDNEPIVRTSIPFEYEPFDQPQLQSLRKQFKLDEVVKDATNEWELISRLAAWSSQRWERGHLAEIYPAWNALDILAEHKDGRPVGGFCQQYNVVFLQACESFGIAGRAVSLGRGGWPADDRRGGHEVVEIWSNDYKKWVYIDGNCAWYMIDEETGTPLSLLELRDRQVAALENRPHRGVRLVKLAETRFTWDGLTSWPPFLELRLIPRSNFLAERSPLPLNQGMRGWFWTGHHVWSDDKLPAALLYGNRVTDRRNFQWDVNRVYCVLEPTNQAGQMRVHLDSPAPGLDAFVARIDDHEPRRVQDGFLWKLHEGSNRLEVRPRNIAGRDGIASTLVLEWTP